MEKQTLSPKMRRQRKVLLVLPLFVLPFITLFFWTLGGGKANAADADAGMAKGYNMNLPGAVIKKGGQWNKLSYYNKAAADSLKIREQMKSDPYYPKQVDSASTAPNIAADYPPAWKNVPGTRLSAAKFSPGNTVTTNEQQVYKKLAQLRTVVNKPMPGGNQGMENNENPQAGSAATQHLQAKLLAMDNPSGDDPQLKQLNGMLEKILDIEHPERVKEKTDPKSGEAENKKFKAIPAVIEGNQKITQGTVVKLKLLDTVTINGQLIPKGQLIFGSGTLYNQRLTMTIKTIHMGYTILPVDLTVFDMVDGLEGVAVPEAVTGDAAKDGAANGVEGLELMNMDQSVGTQLAGAGVNAAKGLFSKKVKRLKGKLKNGHPLLLRDNAKLKA